MFSISDWYTMGFVLNLGYLVRCKIIFGRFMIKQGVHNIIYL